jgi:hypothetical protein
MEDLAEARRRRLPGAEFIDENGGGPARMRVRATRTTRTVST